MKIDIGPRKWGQVPAFGLQSTVQGTVILSGTQKNAEAVTVTVNIIQRRYLLISLSDTCLQLEGRITSTTSHLGQPSGQKMLQILSKVITLYSPACSSAWGVPIPFSFEFPLNFMHIGRPTRLPPSFTTYQPGASSEVTYCLKFDMARKGFRRHEE